jgi:hypothetical protein
MVKNPPRASSVTESAEKAVHPHFRGRKIL